MTGMKQKVNHSLESSVSGMNDISSRTWMGGKSGFICVYGQVYVCARGAREMLEERDMQGGTWRVGRVPALVDVAGEVAAVLALDGHVPGFFEPVRERWRSGQRTGFCSCAGEVV